MAAVRRLALFTVSTAMAVGGVSPASAASAAPAQPTPGSAITTAAAGEDDHGCSAGGDGEGGAAVLGYWMPRIKPPPFSDPYMPTEPGRGPCMVYGSPAGGSVST